MALTTSAQQIIRRSDSAADGELPDQFWELLERYRAELVNQAVVILGSMSDAEDVVQETFCEVFRQPEKLARARRVVEFLAANGIPDNMMSAAGFGEHAPRVAGGSAQAKAQNRRIEIRITRR